jgi:DNA-binding NtrC family response regulator
LLNVLERAQILAEGSAITVGDLPVEFSREHPAGPIPRAEPPGQVVERLAEVEAEHVRRILRKYRGNKVRAALALGISRRTLYRIIEKFNLDGRPGESE